VAATRRHWPTSRGFERFYGFMGGETDQWYPDLVYDNHPVNPPGTPEDATICRKTSPTRRLSSFATQR